MDPPCVSKGKEAGYFTGTLYFLIKMNV